MSTQLRRVDLTDATDTTQRVWGILRAADRPLTRHELAERLGCSRPAVHDAAHALADRGLVETGVCPTEPRAQTLRARDEYRRAAASSTDQPQEPQP